MLTNYNGQTITYDEIGNPINYRNGMTMSWQAGRQLESITQNGKTYNFTYAHDGLRTTKSITSGNTTVDVNYVYEGDKLIQMTYDDYVLTFSYDANGIPVSFHVKNATLDKDYYYGTNSRGDIEVIYNSDGTLHARYDYDAYGKILSVTAPDGTNITAPYAIANLNPLRYRSYVYDTETGLYYLQSRYYDPVTCRFINADAYMSTGQGITGNNMFAYCNNNPVNYYDPSGCMANEHYSGGTSMALPCGYGYSNGGGGGGGASTEVTVQYIKIVRPLFTVGVTGGVGIGFGVACIISEVDAVRKEVIEINKQKAHSKDDNIAVYRYGGTNPGNLTPSQRDVDLYPITGKGLSFSTKPKPGAAKTTIEALNATGVVYAVCDGGSHVSVYPIGGTLEDWHNAGSKSVWTTAVKSVVVKWDGEN